MTIHAGDPFELPDDPVRRLRGRLGGRVSLWTAGEVTAGTGVVGERAGLTVTSLMIAGGEPAHVLGLIDPDSDLREVAEETGGAVVSLLESRHRHLAEAFGGTMPAPGGPFRLTEWTQTRWGPHPAEVSTWAGIRIESLVPVGWSLLVTGAIEELAVGDDAVPLFHRRGRLIGEQSGATGDE
ncbi:MAG: flavin reductase [Nocardioides sp.]|uniref:flavin reductase family protein n=1 Tax=Nocardioides sp. TaxID=35761 RepID=UPI0039E2EE41